MLFVALPGLRLTGPYVALYMCLDEFRSPQYSPVSITGNPFLAEDSILNMAIE
jgi:hypothetical protein